jgi:hypothetical protein
MRRLRFAFALLLPPALLTAGWMFAAKTLQDEAMGWIADQRAEGNVVSVQNLSSCGFPSRVGVQATGLSYTALSQNTDQPSPLAGLTWQASSVCVAIPVWNWGALDVRLQGRHVLSAATTHIDAVLDGVATFDHSGPGGAPRLTAHFSNLEATIPSRLKAAELDLVVRRPDPGLDHFEDGLTPPSFLLRFDGKGIEIQGQALQTAHLALDLMGVLPPPITLENLDVWSRAGGTLNIAALSLQGDHFTASADGTIALDKNRTPEGAFTLRVQNPGPLVLGLRQSGVLTEQIAQNADAVTRLLSRPDSAGTPTLQAPLTLQNQGLYLGPVKIATVTF